MTKIKINNLDVDLNEDQLTDLLRQVPVQKLEKAVLHQQKITDRVKTFEDALAIAGASEDVKTLLAYNGIDPQIRSSQAHTKLSIITKALNEGWAPDWSNTNQYKYWPWLKYTPGVGFSCNGYDCVSAYSAVGSRLCFKSRELAEYAATQFKDIYNDFFN